jgi:hypothetical protein
LTTFVGSYFKKYVINRGHVVFPIFEEKPNT